MSWRFLLHTCLLIVAWTTAFTMPACAQMPSQDEFEAAVTSSARVAHSNGLSLHIGDAWLALARSRTPLLARIAGSRCQIAYSAYTPGRDFTWLFPDMAGQDRRLWIQALVHHELAHCADAVAAISRPAVGDGTSQRRREAVADLAFVLHIDEVTSGESADRLIAKLIALRTRRAAVDPDHDTAGVLGCYLVHPLRGSDRGQGPAEWAARLMGWMHRCWPEQHPS